MSIGQTEESIGEGLQAHAFAVAMVDLSLFLPLVGAVVLLAAVVGLVLWRKHRKTHAEADDTEEPLVAPMPAWDGTVGAEYGSREKTTAGAGYTGPENSLKNDGRAPSWAGQAGPMPTAGLDERTHAAQTLPSAAQGAEDATLTWAFAGLAVKEHEPLPADELHDDEAALREALIRAAASRPGTRFETEMDEESEAPIVEALPAEEALEVEACAEEDLPLVEAQGEKDSVVPAVAAHEPSETQGTETRDVGELEVPEVEAAPVGEDEIPFVRAEVPEGTAGMTEEAEKARVLENGGDAAVVETVQETAAEEGAGGAVAVEAVPLGSVGYPTAETKNAAELALDSPAAKPLELHERREQSSETLGADGQTTFFTFEDLNFQPAEDAQPGEEGLGLSLEEAAAVLASGSQPLRAEGGKSQMEESFPVPGQGAAKATEGSVSTEAANETAGATSRARAEGSKTAVGRKARLKKITLGVPVLVRGPKADPARLREVTQTLIVLPQGAVVSMGATISLGDELNLVNLKTGDEVECRVVGMKLGERGKNDVEIEFLQEVKDFWPVSFPGETQHSRGKEQQLAG